MIDDLLNLLAVIAWIWFVLVVMLIMVRAYQAGGVRHAVKNFLSWRVILALSIALILSLLSAALVFIEPQQVGVVISVISPNGYREDPLRSGLHLIVPLAETCGTLPDLLADLYDVHRSAGRLQSGQRFDRCQNIRWASRLYR